ncbi:PREDICTED: LOW QUALITY PROTEIN: noelin-2-like [Priapulus caudatus]|uniref:LOW QUALITY PROTEIN: noelin-2-like n=1 Tax=Priapulus caudatus TaxID=37621 RepID=A0ABM1F5G3_PRICU|nr:PREDICTED: LOW QUALITY PROTEIN: noelin-2-like [Priapulus caudatus]
MMDPLPPTGDETKIYVLGGYASIRALWMYGSYADFVTRRRKTIITLPIGVAGTGHVIYNGTIYYPQYNTAKVTEAHGDQHLPGALYQNQGQFSFGCYSDIDLAADERGLWAVYTTTANDGYIRHQQNCTPLHCRNTWRTNAKKLNVGNTFFICGVMYSVEAHTILDNRVSYQYDTNTQEQNLISIPFSIKYGLLTQMLYNARHRAIFAWDNGHLISYPVEFQPSR